METIISLKLDYVFRMMNDNPHGVKQISDSANIGFVFELAVGGCVISKRLSFQKAVSQWKYGWEYGATW